ncbi:hypothetical protein HanXRQr2_Chr07g0298101 [Helianthus annuus]|uniref:Uncharacterized protein n=1 Tax=Helianthus annuus TaxID=4232 RepID=A0A9K3IKU9_HELAN|nr:hypothetical protein HanXRQr2_Chr07g0298101 [Helianthus annuus]
MGGELLRGEIVMEVLGLLYNGFKWCVWMEGSGSMICWYVIIWDVLGVCWPKGYNGILGGWSIREFCGEGWNEGYAERSWELVLKLMRILKELMAEEWIGIGY